MIILFRHCLYIYIYRVSDRYSDTTNNRTPMREEISRADNWLVLVKCRQNVANKLFISHYFNPVVPRRAPAYIFMYLQQTDSAIYGEVSTERSHESKGG